MSTETPRIYAACLASYNNGVLYGAWIDADQDAESIGEAINVMLKGSKEPGAEEYAIHDYEYLPSSLGEHPDLDDVSDLGALVTEHGYALVKGVLDHCGDASEVKEKLEDNYAGAWDSLEAYVQNFWEDCGDMPKAPDNQWWHPANYTDWERMAHDLEISGDVFTVEVSGTMHVFHS